MDLLRKIDDAIVRRTRGLHQRGQLGEGFNGDEHRTDGERGADHSIGHPDRNRGGGLVRRAQPDVTTSAHAALNEHRLAVQRMPRIVNRYLLSVVGRM
jgi:hypothetical protein